MQTEATYLVGIHRYSWKAGKPLYVAGVEWVIPSDDRPPRPCFRVMDREDSLVSDLIPVEDHQHYRLISESDVRAGRIPEVTQ